MPPKFSVKEADIADQMLARILESTDQDGRGRILGASLTAFLRTFPAGEREAQLDSLYKKARRWLALMETFVEAKGVPLDRPQVH